MTNTTNPSRRSANVRQRAHYLCMLVAWGTLSLPGSPALLAQTDPGFRLFQLSTNREMNLSLSAPTGQVWRVEASPDLGQWTGLSTFLSKGTNLQVDSAAPFVPQRFYRAMQRLETNVLTGDHVAATNGEITIHPINHATLVMSWNGKVIYSDPVGGAARFEGLPRADLILVTHEHGDHFDVPTLNAVKGTNTVLVLPVDLARSLAEPLKSLAVGLTNGGTLDWEEAHIEAVPAYNLTVTYHPKGKGNGYVLTLGGRRIYVSGDTEDIPETAALRQIDVAFLCMNLPFTMTVDKAANLVRQFQPAVVYPYHYSNSDLARFKRLVGSDVGVEVRLRNWY